MSKKVSKFYKFLQDVGFVVFVLSLIFFGIIASVTFISWIMAAIDFLSGAGIVYGS